MLNKEFILNTKYHYFIKIIRMILKAFNELLCSLLLLDANKWKWHNSSTIINTYYE